MGENEEHKALFLKREMLAGFRWENLKQGNHLHGLGEDGTIKLKFILKKSAEIQRTGLICSGYEVVG
jgi:hypothetical protein